MAQRDYGQFFDSAHAGQTDEDDWRIAAPLHPLLLSCQFTIYWIPPDTSPISGTETRTLISIGVSAPTAFRLLFDAATEALVVEAPGISDISAAISFVAMQEIRIDVDGVAGTFTVSGAATGNGVHAGEPWDGSLGALSVCRIGGAFAADGESAKGWVSLPYARPQTGLGTTGGEPPEVLTLDGEAIELDGEDITLEA
jgi:hypothetical protein